VPPGQVSRKGGGKKSAYLATIFTPSHTTQVVFAIHFFFTSSYTTWTQGPYQRNSVNRSYLRIRVLGTERGLTAMPADKRRSNSSQTNGQEQEKQKKNK